MKLKYYIFLIFLFVINLNYSQNTCNNPIQLCFTSGQPFLFPAQTTGTAQVGPAYGCLATQYKPTWFYFKTNSVITNSVTQFVISSSPSVDVDAIIWGAFSSNINICSQITSSTSIVACSYSTATSETLTISNTQPNMYYALMITNFNGLPTNVNINAVQGMTNIACPAGAPVADFSLSSTSLCAGQTVSLTDLSTPSDSIIAWKYYSAAATPTASTLQNGFLSFNSPGTYSISLMVNTSNSLAAVATKTIKVNPKPTLTVTPANQSICVGSTGTVSLSGALSYTINPGNITSPTYTVNAPTGVMDYYSIQGVNSFGCFSSRTDTIRKKIPPSVLTTVNPNVICLGSTVTFSNSGASTYTLNPSSSTGTTINETPSVAGITIYTVTGSDTLGCTDSKTVSVTTNNLPIVSITPSNTTICNGTSQALTANGPGPLSYFWSSGSTTPSITVSPTITTSYTVTASNSFGCQNTFTTTVNVANTPSVSISSPSTNVCTGYTMAVSAMGATNYTWSTGATSNTTVVQPFFSTMYTVIGSNGGACSDTAFLSITTLPLPSVSATASQTMACVGQTVNLIGIGNATQYLWNPGLLVGQNQTVQITAPITYSLVGQGANGCANYSTVFINANNNSGNVIPVVTPSVVCLGDSAMLSVIGGYVPIWGANSSTFVAPTAPTNYTANVVDLNGCNSNIVFHVGFDSDCGVTVYNGFTPNGDGINDYFFIENIYKFPNNNVHIFNRWGNKLISFSRYNNATNKWDGKINGSVVASGTYYFLITNDNDKVLKKGWVEITN